VDPADPGRFEAPPAPPLADRREPLLAWFARRARDLPWRRSRSPYRVWIAEVMLQQTRAATVAPYYERWMERFPDVATLAAAGEQEVLRAWEGLGYYRRALALHRAARDVVTRAGGRLPEDEEGWRALPGVGPYTAAAVAAQAYGRRTVAVDGNVRRVGARLTASERPRDADLRAALLPLVPEDRPGQAVEALIELGATVCTPRTPACDACPLRPACAAAREGAPQRYPAPAVRNAPPTRLRYGPVWLERDRVWLERRPVGGLLGGLWGLPQRERRPAGRALAPVRHAYTHFRLELVPVIAEDGVAGGHGEARCEGAPPDGADAEAGRWIAPGELDGLPLSVVDRTALARLRDAGLLASAP
jgi:A/G-specific adenine glycosylase